MARRDLGNRASPVDRAHMKRPLYNDMLHYYKSVNTNVFPCNIAVNVICRPLISHCYEIYLVGHLPHENQCKHMQLQSSVMGGKQTTQITSRQIDVL